MLSKQIPFCIYISTICIALAVVPTVYAKKQKNCISSIANSQSALQNSKPRGIASSDWVKSGFTQSEEGYLIHESCKQSFEDKLADRLNSSLQKAYTCLSNLGTEMANDHISKLQQVFSHPLKPVKFVCNEKSKFPNEQMAYASLTKDPKISFNPIYLPHLITDTTIFHESIHLIGYGHTNTIEYAETCANCCFNDNNKEANCAICRGDFQDLYSSEYLRKLAEAIASSYPKLVVKASIHSLLKFPSRRESKFILLQTLPNLIYNTPLYFALKAKLENLYAINTKSEKDALSILTNDFSGPGSVFGELIPSAEIIVENLFNYLDDVAGKKMASFIEVKYLNKFSDDPAQQEYFEYSCGYLEAFAESIIFQISQDIDQRIIAAKDDPIEKQRLEKLVDSLTWEYFRESRSRCPKTAQKE